MSKPKVLIVSVPGMIEEADWQPLTEHAEVDYHQVDVIIEENLADLCAGYQWLMLNYDAVHQLSPAFYLNPKVQALQGISCDITGMDWSSPHSAATYGVPLLHIPHYSTRSVAESILSEILLHSRQRHLAYQDQILGGEPNARQGINLAGRMAGIVGMGDIGTQTADLLKALGMEVLEWHHSNRDRGVELATIFSAADVICICAKTVREGEDNNIGMIDETLLGMCHGAIVVNLANGLLVDPGAMAWAIDKGRVAAYSVDRSPEMIASPLADLPQVHMPPANAWSSPESLAALKATWVDNTLQALQGNLVNLYKP